MALSTEQILLLNNLTYTYENKIFSSNMSDYTNFSVADYIAAIETSGLRDEKDSFMTKSDWEDIISAIKNDDTVMGMRIVVTHVDTKHPNGRGYSVIYADEASKEAVVCFKGTQTDEEWKDNFSGATYTNTNDRVSTECQENALEWYRDAYEKYGLDEYNITVTGHSKGGNKAKYVTIMDNSIDRCLSFDGQGFSDQFVDKYADKIAERQGVIENHNVDNDYVNILLNDVGEQHFYAGQDVGNGGGGFLENHCPNTFFEYKDGKIVMTESPDGRGKGLEEVDQLLNSVLRSLSEEDQVKMAELFDRIRYGAVNGCDADYFLELLSSEKYAELITYFLAYLTEYGGTAETVDKILSCIGGEEFRSIAGAVVKCLQNENVTKYLKLLSQLISGILDFGADKILSFLKDKLGFDCPWSELEKLKKILSVICGVHDTRSKIKVFPDGKDRVVASSRRNADFSVDSDSLIESGNRFINMSKILNEIEEDLKQCKADPQIGIGANAKIVKCAQNLNLMGKRVKLIGVSIKDIGRIYKGTENKIISLN